MQELVELLDCNRLGLEAAAAASSGSNGSPATAAPSRTTRAPLESRSNSSASAAATEGGTSMSPGQSSRAWAAVLRRSFGRAGEVLEVERVATARFVERVGSCRLDVLPEELVCL